MGFCWVSKGNIFNEVKNNVSARFRIQTPDISKTLEGRISQEWRCADPQVTPRQAVCQLRSYGIPGTCTHL